MNPNVNTGIAQFTASGNQGAVPSLDLNSYFTGTNPWTIEGWWVSSTLSRQIVYSQGSGGLGTRANICGVYLGVHQNGYAIGGMGKNTGQNIYVNSTNQGDYVEINDSLIINSYNQSVFTFHHLALTWDGATLSLYVDGILKNAYPVSYGPQFGSNTFPRVAQQTPDGNSIQNCVDGFLDDLRLWSVCRTQAQIQTNYQRELAGNEANLLSYWKFDISTQWNDTSPNDNDLTPVGLPSILAGFAFDDDTTTSTSTTTTSTSTSSTSTSTTMTSTSTTMSSTSTTTTSTSTTSSTSTSSTTTLTVTPGNYRFNVEKMR